MAEIGVTDIVDVTPLDRVGIPVFTAVEGASPRGSPRSSGKGKEPIHAGFGDDGGTRAVLCRVPGCYRMEYATTRSRPRRSRYIRGSIRPAKLEQGEKLHGRLYGIY
jgi:ribosomal protein S12 methylthiotransferase accessory factor